MTPTAPSLRRRSWPYVLTAILALAALILIVWLLTGGDGGAGQASPTPTDSASASESAAASAAPSETPAEPPPTVGWTWELGEFPGGPARGAARIGDRWVVLDGLQAWTSTDAATWDEATVDDTPQEADGQIVLGNAAALGDAYYVVGNWYGPADAVHPVVWRSDDGTAWTQVPPGAPWGYLANDVASSGSRLAVAGSYFDFGDGRVWTSDDAMTWTEHTSDGGPATLNAIHGDEDGFVAVGLRLDGERSLPAIWHSTDGETWTDAQVPAVDTPITLLDVTRLASGRYVAIALRGTETEAGEFVVWYADDPSSWTDALVITAGVVPGILVPTDSGVLAITGAVEGPSLHFSADGANWAELPEFPLPDVVTRATAAAGDGSNVIVIGSTDEADAHFVWRGSPGL